MTEAAKSHGAGTAKLSFAPSARFVSAIGQIRDDSAFKTAALTLDDQWERLIDEVVLITETPAPPFKEEVRGALLARLMGESGLEDIQTDEIGNVYGVLKGARPGPVVAIVAHLDTVFPEGTDVRVTREGDILRGPGVGDNSGSLAFLLAAARELRAGGVETRSDIVFVADVGEEGAGDLRGARHLCLKGPYAGRISHFVAVEPGWNRVTNGATGSKRYRVAFTGPGGHSFFAFGTPNPAYALGRLLVGISQLEVPTTPLTTFSVGVVRGGTSVNAIPERVEVDVDLRSYSDAALTALEQRFLGLPESAAKSKLDNRDGSQKSGIGVELTLIGDRPAGETSADASLVQIAAAALVAEEIEPRIGFDSSDANVPISLGIPAITIGSGFRAFRYHSLDEFIVACRPDVLATMRASLTILIAAANLEDEK